jgi:hypothetical protein
MEKYPKHFHMVVDPDNSYYAVEGAQENKVDELLAELRSVGISPDEWARGAL